MIYFSYSFYKKGKFKMYIFEDLIGYIFLASLLGIVLTIIIGPFVYLTIYIRNKREEKAIELNNNLKREFTNRYQLDIMPNNAIIESTEECYEENYYQLNFPHWKFENMNKTKDNRMNNNYIVWEDSYLYIDNYLISFDNPLSLMDCIYHLRNNSVEIKESFYEIEKINKEKSKFEYNNTLLSITDLIRLYSSKPTDFECYCANIFKKIGFEAVVTPLTNDGGYDIKLLKNNNIFALVECKLFDKTKVGRPLIQKLVGASVTEKANNLIFITTSDFSNEAIEYANATHVQLINGENLIKLSERVYHSDNKNYFDEDSVRLDIQDFLEYIPKDILAICYDNM